MSRVYMTDRDRLYKKIAQIIREHDIGFDKHLRTEYDVADNIMNVLEQEDLIPKTFKL